MRFYTSGTSIIQFVIAHAIVICCQSITNATADHHHLYSVGHVQHSPPTSDRLGQNVKFQEASYNATHYRTLPKSNLAIQTVRRRRQTANPDFTWKVTKTPKFVTAKTEKHPEPVLRVYPPDVVYRSGRSRDLTTPQRGGGRRVIYYATLPEVVRYPPNASPVGERYTNYQTANQQRSFAPSKGGREFVTRVQSSIIDVRPRGENKKEISSTPTFTIIDANPTPYSGYAPYNRIHADYNFMTNVDRPNYNYLSPYYNSPKSQYELLPQNAYKAHYSNPYYSNLDKTQYQLAHYQYQQQSNPYFYNDIGLGKIPSPYYSPPYPSRHTRFPADRYPITSPLSQFDIGLPPTSSPALGQSHSDFGTGSLHNYQSNLGYDGPATTFSSSHSPSLDFNGNLGSSLDHGLDLDDRHTTSPFKDKFLDYNALSQKYFDFNNGFNDFPFKYDHKDPFKFDKEPFKGPFSQVSDWLTNKPFDLSSLDFDDPTGNRDYQIKGSAHSVIVDSQMVNQNMTTAVKDSNSTVITPFTSFNSSSTQDEATNSRR